MKVTPSIFIEVTRVNPLVSDGGSNIFFHLLSENIISVHFDLFNFKLLALDHTAILSSSIVRESALRDGMII